jgi:hypothetical protein
VGGRGGGCGVSGGAVAQRTSSYDRKPLPSLSYRSNSALVCTGGKQSRKARQNGLQCLRWSDKGPRGEVGPEGAAQAHVRPTHLTLDTHKVQAHKGRLELLEADPPILVRVEVAEYGHELCGLCWLVSESGVWRRARGGEGKECKMKAAEGETNKTGGWWPIPFLATLPCTARPWGTQAPGLGRAGTRVRRAIPDSILPRRRRSRSSTCAQTQGAK